MLDLLKLGLHRAQTLTPICYWTVEALNFATAGLEHLLSLLQIVNHRFTLITYFLNYNAASNKTCPAEWNRVSLWLEHPHPPTLALQCTYSWVYTCICSIMKHKISVNMQAECLRRYLPLQFWDDSSEFGLLASVR